MSPAPLTLMDDETLVRELRALGHDAQLPDTATPHEHEERLALRNQLRNLRREG